MSTIKLTVEEKELDDFMIKNAPWLKDRYGSSEDWEFLNGKWVKKQKTTVKNRVKNG